MFNILVVEDDAILNRMIAVKLKQSGYMTYTAFNGDEALAVMDDYHIDLVVTDVMMPKMDGFEFIKTLREAKCSLPILIITAKGELDDMETGFSVGTDDYMVKPINLSEMILRVKALLRRSNMSAEKKLILNNTVLDYDRLTIENGGNVIELPPKEFYLLFKLLSNPGKIFTRLELLDEIWGMRDDIDERNVDAHVKKLRRRFESNEDFELKTVRGLGYKVVVR